MSENEKSLTEAMIAKIDAEIEALQRAKEVLLKLSGNTATDGKLSEDKTVTQTQERLGNSADKPYFNMSIPAAAKKFLTLSQGPKTGSEIAEALEKGGIISQAKSFYLSVYNAMLRDNSFVQLKNKTWGLSEWGIKPVEKQKSGGMKKKKGKSRQTKKEKIQTGDTQSEG